jgi:hypothetical protein
MSNRTGKGAGKKSYNVPTLEDFQGALEQEERLHSPRFASQFMKTELCRFYKRGCNKGASCPFAHGPQELRERPNLEKTSICANFQLGQCPLTAEECQFAHSIAELRATPTYKKSLLCKAFLHGHCKVGNSCRYAHSVNEIMAQKCGDQGDSNVCNRGNTAKRSTGAMNTSAGFSEASPPGPLGFPSTANPSSVRAAVDAISCQLATLSNVLTTIDIEQLPPKLQRELAASQERRQPKPQARPMQDMHASPLFQAPAAIRPNALQCPEGPPQSVGDPQREQVHAQFAILSSMLANESGENLPPSLQRELAALQGQLFKSSEHRQSEVPRTRSWEAMHSNNPVFQADLQHASQVPQGPSPGTGYTQGHQSHTEELSQSQQLAAQQCLEVLRVKLQQKGNSQQNVSEVVSSYARMLAEQPSEVMDDMRKLFYADMLPRKSSFVKETPTANISMRGTNVIPASNPGSMRSGLPMQPGAVAPYARPSEIVDNLHNMHKSFNSDMVSSRGGGNHGEQPTQLYNNAANSPMEAGTEHQPSNRLQVPFPDNYPTNRLHNGLQGKQTQGTLVQPAAAASSDGGNQYGLPLAMVTLNGNAMFTYAPQDELYED